MADLSKDLSALRIEHTDRGAGRRGASILVGIVLALVLAGGGFWFWSAKLQAGAGIFLEEAGRDAEAETHLRRAVEIDPTYAQMHYNLGVLLARRGAADEAAEHFRRAIELVPGNPMPRRALADLMRKAKPAAP